MRQDDPWTIIEKLLALHAEMCRSYRVPGGLGEQPVKDAAAWLAEHRAGRGVTLSLEPLLQRHEPPKPHS